MLSIKKIKLICILFLISLGLGYLTSVIHNIILNTIIKFIVLFIGIIMSIIIYSTPKKGHKNL